MLCCSFNENRAQFWICLPNSLALLIFSFLSLSLFALDCSRTVSIAKFIYICLGIIRFCCISFVDIEVVAVLVAVRHWLCYAYFSCLRVQSEGLKIVRQCFFTRFSLSFFSLKIINEIAHDFAFHKTWVRTSHNKQTKWCDFYCYCFLFFRLLHPRLFWEPERGDALTVFLLSYLKWHHSLTHKNPKKSFKSQHRPESVSSTSQNRHIDTNTDADTRLQLNGSTIWSERVRNGKLSH